MDQRTCNIIMCCKGHCMLPKGKDKGHLEAVAAYMSEECDCPIGEYTDAVLEQIMKTALYDYLNSASKPGNEMRRMFDELHVGPTASLGERIAITFSLAQVSYRRKDAGDGVVVYVNGFTDELVAKSRIALGEDAAPKGKVGPASAPTGTEGTCFRSEGPSTPGYEDTDGSCGDLLLLYGQ